MTDERVDGVVACSFILALIQDTYLYDAQRRPHARPPGREEGCQGIGSRACTAIYMIAHRAHP